jgi:hypothetical protein
MSVICAHAQSSSPRPNWWSRSPMGARSRTPLDWYPRLKAATQQQRANYEIMPLGIHWPDLDEDLSIAGMLKGCRA